MAIKTKIGWTDATINFWTGCAKVSEACKFCYMFRDMERFKKNPLLINRTGDKTFYKALSWKQPKRIFTCSWSDFFLEDADDFRADAWQVIKDTPQHTWLILTKRPERIKECLPDDWGSGYHNVWIGVTAENQDRLKERLPYLVDIPAKVRFLSIEPILGAIDFFDEEVTKMVEQLHWIIVGGESGNETGKFRYRPSELNWYRSLVVQAKTFNLPIFVKQLGTFLAKKAKVKRDRHGSNLESLPKSLQYREFPKPKRDAQLKIF